MRYLQQCFVFVAAGVLATGGDRPEGPGLRNAHAMAFDERRGVTLLFGGASDSQVLADVWSWDGERWTSLPLRGPEPRTFPVFVWDAARAEAVLFGGRNVLFGREGQRRTCLSDTWVLRDTWQRRPVIGLPARCEAGGAFDRHRGVVVVFGGYSDAGAANVRLGDTWEWDGVSWHLRAGTGPAPRSGAAMAYDERLRRVVLFGGSGGPRSDTWTWNGVRWEVLNTPDTPGRFNSIAAFDPGLQQVVRTTGWNGSARVREMWTFDGARWQLAAPGGPGARNHSAAAFDRRRNLLVLHGGHDGTLVFGDTWEWASGTWRERVRAQPRPRVENGH